MRRPSGSTTPHGRTTVGDAIDFTLLVLFLALLVVVAVLLLAAGSLAAMGFSGSVGNRQEPLHLEYEALAEPISELRRMLVAASPVMRDADYEQTWVDTDLACYVRRYRPAWLILVAILLVPLGLLLLLWAAQSAIVFQVLPGAHPRVVVSGKLGHRSQGQLRQALSEIAEERKAPGWYVAEPGVERYWDGESWTDRTRPERVVVGPRMVDAPRR